MSYTEKVIEYFKNPKNMGRIENPDGLGKVGNPVCLLPEEKIHCEETLMPMLEVKPDMKVITHSGQYCEITNTVRLPYKGQILTLKNKLGKISLTPNHLIYAIQIPKGDKYLRTKNRKNLISAWYHAGDLKKGDLVLFPKKKYELQNKDIPENLSLNEENYFYLPITDIKKREYSGHVMNLEVEKDHSFTSEGFCLHNCGDVMWIYIKVKDEKIEDIKFETFGCAAAIATSSVVTELAKGKTLDEALKITNKDVVEFLGGLPSIKRHCSLLAEEGLRAAIEDYRKRKNEGAKA